MDVMDLSMRKSPQIFSSPDHYIMQDISMYAPLPSNFPTSPAQTSAAQFDLRDHYGPNTTTYSREDSILTIRQADIHSPTTSISSDKDLDGDSNLPTKRPFKAVSYTKTGVLTLVSALDPLFETEYKEYRKQILSRISHDTPSTNKNMRRSVPLNPEKSRDPEYLEKRRKNNEAAKKSREARKAKEDELAIRVAFLEKENLKMKFQLAAIEREKKKILVRRAHI